MSNGDTYHHGDLRRALIDGALALISEKGLQNFSLRECARRAGVSHAAPYRHFPDKQALIHAIAMEGFQELTRSGLQEMEGLAPPRDRLNAYGVAYVLYACAHPAHHAAMFSASFDEATASDALRQAADAAFGLLLACVVALDPGEDPLLGATHYWSLVHGLANLIIAGRIPAEHVSTEEALRATTLKILTLKLP